MTPREVIEANTLLTDGLADMILEALAAAGFAVVPVEPTKDMKTKGFQNLQKQWQAPGGEMAGAMWKAMIRAAQRG